MKAPSEAATVAVSPCEQNRQPSARPRILLLAYACSPYRGSEQGVGWHRALQAARFADTWVICKQQQYEEDIARFAAANGLPAGLHFCYVPRTAFEKLLKLTPGFWYLAYNLWHRRAYRRALDLHREISFDLAHQVTMCGFREPGYLWKLGIPFVWGPIGGTQDYPSSMYPMAGLRGVIEESLRTCFNRLQLRYTPRIRKAVEKADLLLAANSTAVRDMEHYFRRKALLNLDIGSTSVAPERPSGGSKHRELRILWSGVFEHRKALQLLLHALAGTSLPMPYALRILGSGSEGKRWKRLARSLSVDRHCEWLGWLPHENTREQYAWADVFVFTSLRDTCGTVVLEALSNGAPVICLDHQGAGDVVTPDCGIKIPVTDPVSVVRAFRDALIALGQDRERLEALSQGARKRAQVYLWDRKGEEMGALYRSIATPGRARGKA